MPAPLIALPSKIARATQKPTATAAAVAAVVGSSSNCSIGGYTCTSKSEFLATRQESFVREHQLALGTIEVIRLHGAKKVGDVTFRRIDRTIARQYGHHSDADHTDSRNANGGGKHAVLGGEQRKGIANAPKAIEKDKPTDKRSYKCGAWRETKATQRNASDVERNDDEQCEQCEIDVAFPRPPARRGRQDVENFKANQLKHHTRQRQRRREHQHDAALAHFIVTQQLSLRKPPRTSTKRSTAQYDDQRVDEKHHRCCLLANEC
jgi:hypothetical protein